MLIARTDLLVEGGKTLPKGSVIREDYFSDPRPLVRVGKLWELDDEALGFAVEHLSKQSEQKAAAGGKRR